MGSHTKISGKFKLKNAVTANVLKQITVESMKIYISFFHDEKNHTIITKESLKDNKKKYNVLIFNDDWKNLYQDDTIKFAKDALNAFGKHGVELIEGHIWCRHEYGEMWKVFFNPSKIMLLDGEITYKENKTIELAKNVLTTKTVNFEAIV